MTNPTPVMPTPRASAISEDPVGRYLREMRLKRDLTQETLANEVGISQIAVSEIERGTRPIETVGFARVMNLLKALNITLIELTENTGLDLDGSIVWQFEKAGVVLDAMNAAKDYSPPIHSKYPITPESIEMGKQLRAARKKAGLSIKAAVERSGVGGLIIDYLEAGHNLFEDITVGMAKHMHLAFGLTPLEFWHITGHLFALADRPNISKPLAAVLEAVLESDEARN